MEKMNICGWDWGRKLLGNFHFKHMINHMGKLRGNYVIAHTPLKTINRGCGGAMEAQPTPTQAIPRPGERGREGEKEKKRGERKEGEEREGGERKERKQGGFAIFGKCLHSKVFWVVI